MRPVLVALAGIVASAAWASPARAAFPIHAVVVGFAGPHAIVARTPGATGMLAAGTYRFAVAGPPVRLRPGTEIDAIAHAGPHGESGRLTEVTPAPAFVAGLPGTLRVQPIRAGDRLPDDAFVDQTGRVVRFSDWRGKTVVLSFVYTRCPLVNVCPAVSGKFSYLQRRIDPARTHLAIVTLDPVFDSPSVLERYGTKYETNAARWSLLTGEGHVVKSLLDRLQIAPLEDAPGNFIHEEALVLADGTGTVREIIPTPDWDPSGVLAEVRSEQGQASNPFERMLLAAVAGIAAICGGQSIASFIVVLVATAITIVVAACAGGWFVWRLLYGEGRPSRKSG